MAFPHFDLVQQAYQELVSEGWIKELEPGHQPEVECQKRYLTARAAFYANIQDENLGLIEKTFGNNCEGYSVDLILNRVTGMFWDVATDNGRIAIPVQGGEHQDSNLIPRWRKSTRELAKLDAEPIPEPEPEPEPPPLPDDIKELLVALLNLQLEQTAKIELILARQDTHDAQFNNIRLKLQEIREKQNHPYSYSNRFIGGITPVGV